MKQIAWFCLRDHLYPEAIRDSVLLSALQCHADEPVKLLYLRENLRLIQFVGAENNRYRISFDPLAEYLAGLHLVDFHQNDPTFWNDFFQHASIVTNESDCAGFLGALKECFEVKADRSVASQKVIEQISELTRSRSQRLAAVNDETALLRD